MTMEEPIPLKQPIPKLGKSSILIPSLFDVHLTAHPQFQDFPINSPWALPWSNTVYSLPDCPQSVAEDGRHDTQKHVL